MKSEELTTRSEESTTRSEEFIKKLEYHLDGLLPIGRVLPVEVLLPFALKIGFVSELSPLSDSLKELTYFFDCNKSGLQKININSQQHSAYSVDGADYSGMSVCHVSALPKNYTVLELAQQNMVLFRKFHVVKESMLVERKILESSIAGHESFVITLKYPESVDRLTSLSIKWTPAEPGASILVNPTGRPLRIHGWK